MKRGGFLRRRTPLRPVSDKRRRENATYRTRRDDYLQQHPVCEFPLGCNQRATEVHHKRGRFGGRLLDEAFWAASCREHNTFAEIRTGEALAIGWLIPIGAVS